MSNNKINDMKEIQVRRPNSYFASLCSTVKPTTNITTHPLTILTALAETSQAHHRRSKRQRGGEDGGLPTVLHLLLAQT